MTVDELRAAMSAWLTVALDLSRHGPTEIDLLELRDWIDGGCDGDVPMPRG